MHYQQLDQLCTSEKLGAVSCYDSNGKENDKHLELCWSISSIGRCPAILSIRRRHRSVQLTLQHFSHDTYKGAAEQKARSTYEYLIDLAEDPDVLAPLRFLREREVVHFQRFGEALEIARDHLNQKHWFFK